MDELMMILPVILYLLGIALVIILIVLGIKLIDTINKANRILDDVERKTKSLNGVFNVIDGITDKLSLLSNSLVEGISNTIAKLFKRKNKKKEIDEDE